MFVSAIEFFHSNMLQKLKSDIICVTFCSDKILLQRQRFSQIYFFSTHEVICRCDVSPQHVAATSHQTCTHRVICLCNLSPGVY